MKTQNAQKVSLTSALPKEDMEDVEWQEYFSQMKKLVAKSNKRRMTLYTTPIFAREYSDDQLRYYGDTQWAKYREFINSILYALRRGEQDYCFYIYQIAELLRYEHDNLRTQWLPEYKSFRVWLEN